MINNGNVTPNPLDQRSVPLVIDLDGTLTKTDLLHESFLGFLRQNPLSCFGLLTDLMASKAKMKARIANQVSLDVSTLPYNPHVIELIRSEKKKGRQIVLATASHQIYADAVAQHLGLFDLVLATNETINLTSSRKAERLVELFGEKGFDYAGNSMDDIAVWKSCNNAIVVEPHAGVESKARKVSTVSQVISSEQGKFRAFIKAIRLHQWAKNLLIFVPLLASHQILDINKLTSGVLAFLFFGLCASSVYILNDLLDIQDDRHHRTKRNRPFASARLPITLGIFLFPALLVAAFIGSILFLPIGFIYSLIIYYIITVLYSFYLKRLMVIDVIGLAVLYTMRIIAGTFAFGLDLTFWMLAFSMFIFLSLALVKRYTELIDARNAGILTKTRGRGYYPDDLEMISSLGAASGYISVMVLALYIQDQATINLYGLPEVIWLACPLLLFWISRIWLLAHRGKMHDDPVVFAIKDKVSVIIGVLFGLIFWLAV